jgi:REP element-mobilizing transposase RayT
MAYGFNLTSPGILSKSARVIRPVKPRASASGYLPSKFPEKNPLAPPQHPLIYLLTFTTYGAYLPGDARGSFDHARAGVSRFIPPNPALERYHRRAMSSDSFALSTAPQRQAVRDAILQVCAERVWLLRALHIRTTHVHGIVESNVAPRRVVEAWKAYATRSLTSSGLIDDAGKIWTRGSNARRLDSPDAVRSAIG